MIGKARAYLSGSGLGPTLVKAVTGSAGLGVAGMGFGFLVGVQLARGLGAEGYGIYGVAMSIIALLTVPTEFGLPQLLTREVAAAQVRQDWGKMKGILHWSTRVSMLIAILITVAIVTWLWLSGHGLSSQLGMTLLAGLVMVPVVALVSLRSAALRGLQQIVRGQLPDVLLRPMFYSFFLLVVPLFAFPLNPPIAMTLGVLSASGALLVANRMLRVSMPVKLASATPVIDSRDWWSSALPMAMTESVRLFQGHFLILVLGVMATAVDVGLFRMAASIALLVGMPAGLFGTVGGPIFAKLYAANDRHRMQQLLGWIAFCMTAGSMLLSLPFFLVGSSLLATIFGQEYQPANSALLIMSAGMVLSNVFGANAVLLTMTGHQSVVTRASLLALVCMLLISVPLIRLFGINGAAVANAACLVVWKLALWLAARKLARMDTSLLALFGRSWNS